MKFYLISDNHDTYMGMRMTGVEGCVVHTAKETEEALEQASQDPEIGIVLITAKLLEITRSTVYAFKQTRSRPLVVEVADRHGEGKISDSLSRYVREAVGIKID